MECQFLGNFYGNWMKLEMMSLEHCSLGVDINLKQHPIGIKSAVVAVNIQ